MISSTIDPPQLWLQPPFVITCKLICHGYESAVNKHILQYNDFERYSYIDLGNGIYIRKHLRGSAGCPPIMYKSSGNNELLFT